jgi:hypothetical protein
MVVMLLVEAAEMLQGGDGREGWERGWVERSLGWM